MDRSSAGRSVLWIWVKLFAVGISAGLTRKWALLRGMYFAVVLLIYLGYAGKGRAACVSASWQDSAYVAEATFSHVLQQVRDRLKI